MCSLLFAREHLPPLVASALESDLLPAQGIGVLRRDGGALYVALDYGHPGGGHGHPDRLNLLLADRDARWFDDPGTGSYVDPSLHWYRSTLAHTAPLVDGRSQPAVSGRLLAFEDHGEAGWISAVAPLAADLRVRRTVVLLNDYLVDLVEWDRLDTVHEVALPGTAWICKRFDEPLARTPLRYEGETREDGFGFLSDPASCLRERRASRTRSLRGASCAAGAGPRETGERAGARRADRSGLSLLIVRRVRKAAATLRVELARCIARVEFDERAYASSYVR